MYLEIQATNFSAGKSVKILFPREMKEYIGAWSSRINYFLLGHCYLFCYHVCSPSVHPLFRSSFGNITIEFEKLETSIEKL